MYISLIRYDVHLSHTNYSAPAPAAAEPVAYIYLYVLFQMQSCGLLPCLRNSCIGAQIRQIFPKRTAHRHHCCSVNHTTASTSISFQVLQQLATARRVNVKKQEHAHSIQVIKELDDLYEELEEVFCEY